DSDLVRFARRRPPKAEQLQPDGAVSGGEAENKQRLLQAAVARRVRWAWVLGARAGLDRSRVAGNGHPPDVANGSRAGERDSFPLTNVQRQLRGYCQW